MKAGTGILLAAVVLIGLEVIAASPLRVLLVLAASGGAIAILASLQWRKVLSPGFRTPFLLCVAASLIPVLALGVLTQDNRVHVVVLKLVPTLTGWAVFLALLLGSEASAGKPKEVEPSRAQLIGALGAVFVLIAAVHWIAVSDGALIADEVVYLVQSRWIRPGQWTQSIDTDIAPFFLMRQITQLDGHLVGQYPSGWPTLLAGFRMIGLEWWSSVILGTASVALTYALGARLVSRTAGVIAALLLATSQQYLVIHAGYMAHAACITSLLGATYCLLSGIDGRGWRRVVPWIGAGILFGVAVASRPLTGLSVAMSIGLWMLARAWQADRRSVVTLALCVAAGGLLPASLFIAHNVAVNGGPLVLGYDAIHEGLYHLGFGTHGYMVLDENVNRVPLTFPFTFAEALTAFVARLAEVNISYLAIGLVLPVIVAAAAAGYRFRWGLVAVFLILPLTQFFYRYSSLRMYIELLPFFMIAAGSMLVAVRARWPRLATGLIAMTVLSQLITLRPAEANRPLANRFWQASDYPRSSAPARRMALATADSLANVHGRILLFSKEATRFDNLIDRLYQYNTPDFTGPILVARHRGALNEELIRRHPDRVPFLVEDRHGGTPAEFTPIAKAPALR